MSTRLFVSAALSNGVRIALHGEQARYLGRVLRARVGDTVRVFNGNHGEWSATIENISKSDVALQVEAHIRTETESLLKVHLVQGVPRGERMDFVVQKATELGVKRITPVFTDFGVVRLNDKRAARRREHWQRVAENACEQSGRIRVPLIDAPLDLNAWLGMREAAGSTQLILRPTATRRLGATQKPQTKLCLLIGPEGGFSDREYEDAEVAGFEAVFLGPRILRAETAAIAALALAQSLWGDM